MMYNFRRWTNPLNSRQKEDDDDCQSFQSHWMPSDLRRWFMIWKDQKPWFEPHDSQTANDGFIFLLLKEDICAGMSLLRCQLIKYTHRNRLTASQCFHRSSRKHHTVPWRQRINHIDVVIWSIGLTSRTVQCSQSQSSPQL
jgi:hypothetical protein